jgi:hypothetical protein
MCQPELQFSRPKVTASMVEQMEQLLIDSPEPWVFASTISSKLQLGTGEAGKRIVRELASQSGGRIISGQRGYCYVQRASIEEVEHSSANLVSQAQVLIIRARDQRRAKGIE